MLSLPCVPDSPFCNKSCSIMQRFTKPSMGSWSPGAALLPFYLLQRTDIVQMDKIPLETSIDDAVIRYRDCFSVRYIQAAALLCRLGYTIEQQYRGAPDIPQDALLRHEAFMLNSILSSVAFLESAINDLYADAADEAYLLHDESHEALLHRISEGWKNEKNFDRAPLLTRYQKILALADIAPFEEGDRAYDNVRDLIEIRNYLMHHRREWVEVGEKGVFGTGEKTTAEKFARALKRKFAVNPFAHKSLPFFPDQCLGHGCAEWAVVNSLIFTDAFFQKLGIAPPYHAVREELMTR
jgi:hypothetical protein